MGWEAHAGDVVAVRVCIDGNRSLSIGADNLLLQWDVRTMGRQQLVYEYAGRCSSISGDGKGAIFCDDIAVEGSGEYFAVGTADGFADIYRVNQPEALQRISGHGQAVTTLDWRPLSDCLITGSLDKSIRMTKLLKM